MANMSKSNDPRCWKKWYESGAIMQIRLCADDLRIAQTDRTIEGHRVLWLGEHVPELNWFLRGIVVPYNPAHVPGGYLHHLPGNAIPVEIYNRASVR
jgi:hypothetical protein